MLYHITSNYPMILTPDCDQFFTVRYLGGYWTTKNSIKTTQQLNFVLRELFNMAHLQILYVQHDDDAENIFNTVPPQLRKNLRNINYNSMSVFFNDNYTNMLISYLNGNNFSLIG